MTVETKQLKEALMDREWPNTQPRQVARSGNCHAVLTSLVTAAHTTSCCDRSKLSSEVVGGKQVEMYKLKMKRKHYQCTEKSRKFEKSDGSIRNEIWDKVT